MIRCDFRPLCLAGLLAMICIPARPAWSADAPVAAARSHDFARWEPAIAAFEAADREQPPASGGVVFVGSSTIRMWNTSELLADLPVINRGFGGSEMVDSAHFAERIVLPYRPRVVLVYAGSNDLSKEATPCQVLADFATLVEKVHAVLPETEVVFLSIKPSRKRWPLIHRIRATNALIEAYCIDGPHRHFLNVHEAMLNAEGQPEEQYLAADGLHLNPEGYRRLTELVRPTIERLLQAPKSPAAAVAPAPIPAAASARTP